MQGDGPFTDGINVTIRRNYIYEDAYDKLSPENGTETHIKTREILVILHTAENNVGCVIISYLFFSCFIEISFVFRVELQGRFCSCWLIFQESVIVVTIIIMAHIKAESIILSHLFCVWIWEGTWVETLWLKRVVGDLGWRHDLYHLCVYNLQLPWFICPH